MAFISQSKSCISNTEIWSNSSLFMQSQLKIIHCSVLISLEQWHKEIQLEFRGKPLNPAVISTFLWVFLLYSVKIWSHHHEYWCHHYEYFNQKSNVLTTGPSCFLKVVLCNCFEPRIHIKIKWVRVTLKWTLGYSPPDNRTSSSFQIVIAHVYVIYFQCRGIDASIFQLPSKIHLTVGMLTLLSEEDVVSCFSSLLVSVKFSIIDL